MRMEDTEGMTGAPDWVEAMWEDYDSFTEGRKWEVIDRRKDSPTVLGQWVSKRKIGPTGEIARPKARFIFDVD